MKSASLFCAFVAVALTAAHATGNSTSSSPRLAAVEAEPVMKKEAEQTQKEETAAKPSPDDANAKPAQPKRLDKRRAAPANAHLWLT